MKQQQVPAVKTMILSFLLVAMLLPGLAGLRAATPLSGEIFAVDQTSRCPVCGMFVHKYPEWQAQIRLSDGTVAAFDGVKDLLAYFFSPQSYGAAPGAVVDEVAVREYYNLTWIDGRTAHYVVGSAVHGPMGHELIPFADRAAAENFARDHQGEQILTFAEITPALVASLRQGMRLRPDRGGGRQ
jgi:copper chaperone NosL